MRPGCRACNGWMGDTGPSKQAKDELPRRCRRLSIDREGHPRSHVTKVPAAGTMAVQLGALAEASGGKLN